MTNQNGFRRAILKWYGNNGRDLPWRRTRNPYAVLVSEFMLQQTQVATVLRYYRDWFERFPNFVVLAKASESAVLHAWQGLGYYARARNLHATAKIVVDQHGGRFPHSIEQMQQLPGVGKYTAHAIATFAFNQSVPIIEANTSRVLARLFNLRRPIDSTAGRAELWNTAAPLVPTGSPATYNSALIDLGALVCLPGRPKCGVCPVKRFCKTPHPELLPLKRTRPATEKSIEQHLFVRRKKRLLLAKAGTRWRGMWILPPIGHDCLKRPTSSPPIYQSDFAFTHHKITLQVFTSRGHKRDNRDQQRWFSGSALRSIPIPSPHRRAIEQLFRAA
jgi:A/G-specific adenine glycosylase